MKKIFKILKIPVIVILSFVIQIFIANNLEIFGVTPNILLVTVVIISMWSSLAISVIVASLIGVCAELIFNFTLGQSFVAYLVIAMCISYISRRYRKESKAAIVYITAIATCIFTIFQFIYYIIDHALILNIFAIIQQVIVEILLNISIAYILYKIFEKSMKNKILDNVYR